MEHDRQEARTTEFGVGPQLYADNRVLFTVSGQLKNLLHKPLPWPLEEHWLGARRHLQ